MVLDLLNALVVFAAPCIHEGQYLNGFKLFE